MQVVSEVIIDDLGREIELNDVPKRLISLPPSITEIIYFIEIEDVRFEHKVYYYVYQEGRTFNEVAYIERREQI